MLQQARQFAIDAHGDQQYGERPYAYHLDMVARLLRDYGELAQVIGYLHDVVEDTAVDCAQIAEHFGPLVAECVALLTDEPGANRKERKAKTYAKLAQVCGEVELALVVKAADRLANLTECVADANHAMWTMYRNEHRVFRRAAYRAGLCDELWQAMDGLLRHERMSVT